MNKSISIIAVDTDPVTYPLLKYAVKTTLQNVEVSKILYFGEKPLGLGEDFVRINQLKSVNDYSLFVLKSLWSFVDTEFVLIVQWDGFAVNPACWTDEFLSIDYIGAPWIWAKNGMSVGNGGFSLRSAKLIEACKHWSIAQNPKVLFGMAEDVLIGHYYRQLFESNGIQFATPELAARFSYETGARSNPTLGFHGVANLPFYVCEKDLLENATSLFLKIQKNPLYEEFKKSCAQQNYHELLALALTTEKQA